MKSFKVTKCAKFAVNKALIVTASFAILFGCIVHQALHGHKK
jgi:hypothetical protein